MVCLLGKRQGRRVFYGCGQVSTWMIHMDSRPLMMNSAAISFGFIQIPIELFALFAMIPICLYSGRKATASRAVQLGFYLFYPVHLAVLAVIMKLCFGG